MRALLFRHAERQNTGSPNPPLSPRGLKQAVHLADSIQTGAMPYPTRFYSSPKLRAQQTFFQAYHNCNLELSSPSDLDERKNSESMSQFKNRVQKFLQFVESQRGIIYFVTHLDWIEEALLLIHSDTDLSKDQFQNWQPGQFAEFEVHDGLWMLQKLSILEG